MSEIARNIACFRQPSPAKNPGGDCFACSLKAAVDGLFPEKPIPFETAWEAFKVKSYGGDMVLSNTWPTMRSAAYSLRSKGWDLTVHYDFALSEVDIEHFSCPWGVQIAEPAWSYRLEAWLAAGWLALVQMNFAGAGPVNPNGTRNNTDHFVCLDGQRHFWKESVAVKGASSLEHETHVVCSAKGPYWIDTADLLCKHGVGAVMLIRRGETARRAAGVIEGAYSAACCFSSSPHTLRRFRRAAARMVTKNGLDVTWLKALSIRLLRTEIANYATFTDKPHD